MLDKENLHYYIFNCYKNDQDFINTYKKYKGSLKGFKAYFNNTIEFFINDFNVYLDAPYLDISYLRVKDSYIDIDLLYDIFKDPLKESNENENIKKGVKQ